MVQIQHNSQSYFAIFSVSTSSNIYDPTYCPGEEMVSLEEVLPTLLEELPERVENLGVAGREGHGVLVQLRRCNRSITSGQLFKGLFCTRKSTRSGSESGDMLAGN
jgi:hypothetical protein